jgi:DNA polymerase-3 subunit epsilon
MGTTFVAVDVETANADLSSVCEVGAVRVRDGALCESFTTFVNPQTYFDSWNVSIHGITENMVRNAPAFPELAAALSDFVGPCLVASHTAFDRVAFDRVHARYRLAPPTWSWLDTARVARRAWADRFAHSGYGLAQVADYLGIEFHHHRALEDARTAAQILLRAVAHVGLDLEAWQHRVHQPIFLVGARIARDGNPEGPLAGDEVAFTGSLMMTRAEAAEVAADLGCDVGEGVTRKTTILVVGIQDEAKLHGYEKSAKHRKAEKLNAAGQPIKILSEDDFLALVDLYRAPTTV